MRASDPRATPPPNILCTNQFNRMSRAGRLREGTTAGALDAGTEPGQGDVRNAHVYTAKAPFQEIDHTRIDLDVHTLGTERVRAPRPTVSVTTVRGRGVLRSGRHTRRLVSAGEAMARIVRSKLVWSDDSAAIPFGVWPGCHTRVGIPQHRSGSARCPRDAAQRAVQTSRDSYLTSEDDGEAFASAGSEDRNVKERGSGRFETKAFLEPARNPRGIR